MTKQLSFTKYEKKVFPSYRQKISKAESIEDVKKIYDYAVSNLLSDVFEGKIEIQTEDMMMDIKGDRLYLISDRLQSSDVFMEVWRSSDLPQIMDRLSEMAIHRVRHLEKNPKKTEAKIRK